MNYDEIAKACILLLAAMVFIAGFGLMYEFDSWITHGAGLACWYAVFWLMQVRDNLPLEDPYWRQQPPDPSVRRD